MPEIKSLIPAKEKLIQRANLQTNRIIREEMVLYRNNLTSAIEKAMGFVSGGQILNPSSYNQNREQVILSIRKDMQAFWDNLIPIVNDFGEAAYKETRKLDLAAFSKLFNIKFKTVPDKDLPEPASPDSNIRFDLNSTDLLSEARSTDFPSLTITVGTGGLDAEYERLLRQQFNSNIDPRNAITTFGAKDVARIEHEMIKGLQEGVDNTVIRKRLVKQLVSKGASPLERKRIEANIRRILRTTHENASIASAFQFAATNPAVTSIVRHTGPRPCIACISLDGRVYTSSLSFRDHVNGQCFITYETRTASSLGIDLASATADVKRAFRTNFGNIRPRRYDFMAASDAEQQKIFANKGLYQLWKQEKLPLEAMLDYQNGSFVQTSLTKALSNLNNLGGLSYPKIAFPTEAAKIKFNPVLDPKDRANEALTFSEGIPSTTELNTYRQPRYPDSITGTMVDSAPASVRDEVGRITEGYFSPNTMPHYAFNDLARVLRLGIRHGTDGKKYYVVHK